MQSSRSETFAEVFRNPTVLAMIGSVGVHGVLVLFSAMKPADSLPAPLRVISLDPSSTTTDLNALLTPSNTLPVPNSLPPINFGDVPELSALPDLSKFRSPSQSVFLGSNPSAIDFGKLSIANPPQKSILGAQGRVYGLNLPKSPSQGGANASQSPFGGILSSGQLSGVPQPDYSRYALSPNPTPPNLAPSSSPIGSASALSTPYEPFSPSAAATPPATPNPATSGNNAAPVRASYTGWLAAQSQAFGKPISTQPGPRLTAEYPSSACSSKVQGSAIIAAVFGPDGSIAKGDSVIQVLQSAETLALNRAAIAAVESYRLPTPSGIPQAFNFTVDIPYSEAICKADSSSSPESSTKPGSSLKESPKPTSAPTGSPSPASKEDILDRLTPKTPTSSSPLKTPLPTVSKPQTQTSQFSVSPPQATSNFSQAQSPEPLPTPSIAVPEGASTSP
jgi:Gram-negative bacterial TonB protein C-terminal